MKHIIKYKKFEDTRKIDYSQPRHSANFIDELARHSINPYSVGIYRFKSFDDARRFDLEVRIKASVKGNRK